MDDRSETELTNNVPDGTDHRKLKENGQQLAYVVLTEAERAKGFVRPVRRSYIHVGQTPPTSLRDLTPDEMVRYSQFGYVKFEPYGPERLPVTGKFWIQSELDSSIKKCGAVTTMSQALAETYARNPQFYSGTFCTECQKHFSLDQFKWVDTNETVGS